MMQSNLIVTRSQHIPKYRIKHILHITDVCTYIIISGRALVTEPIPKFSICINQFS